ncbi:SPC12-domain-containing protein [Tilletiopsis washingtonensis]|uniref:Signal peptidase complex subunit 1 n=1 Tax=Tilletiopsis washingtonensis TaxID=58919 RepID=A0A316Z8G5_9BASI|nr:SPC12-domain-containing protein [Tilletiopsis washingtonensis]PWN97889.1 SPC12-domain-containing protein [Tilletiopsis washingtonensis]
MSSRRRPVLCRAAQIDGAGVAVVRSLRIGQESLQGQRLADRINQETLVLAAVLAFIAGWALDSQKVLMLVYGAGVALALVACVPPWEMYNRHPTRWLEPRESAESKKDL